MCHHGKCMRSVWPTSFPSFLFCVCVAIYAYRSLWGWEELEFNYCAGAAGWASILCKSREPLSHHFSPLLNCRLLVSLMCSDSVVFLLIFFFFVIYFTSMCEWVWVQFSHESLVRVTPLPTAGYLFLSLLYYKCWDPTLPVDSAHQACTADAFICWAIPLAICFFLILSLIFLLDQ